MLVLRLQRTGRKNLATYRIVAAEKARPVKGKSIEILGHYLPAEKKPVLSVNTERATFWISKGAIPSDTVARILSKQGMKGMEKYMDRYTKKRSKSAPAEEPAAPAAAAPTPAAEPVAEAAPAEAPVAEAPAAPAAEAATTDDNAEKKE
ncbi:30S ribosomal protein S16 [Candidatus Peribacteria bacterium]|nr:MAG: 30S ribosomal protein S16 [Candidatus Peribacteria bacterium]